MSKINIIIRREYLSRVRKKSFIIMTFLSPILLAFIIIFPVYMAKNQKIETRNIAIIDKSTFFTNVFIDDDHYNFDFLDTNTNPSTYINYYYAIVEIPKDYEHNKVKVYSKENISLETYQYIQALININARDIFLKQQKISPEIIQEANKIIKIESYKVSKDASKIEEASSGVAAVLGYIGAFIIYMFIFTYGAQLMQSTMLEKKDRIIEVLASSVKPFDLLMGKIIGVAMVAFTQFFMWIILLAIILFSLGNQLQANQIREILVLFKVLTSQQTLQLLILFIIYFVGGYLLYGSLFAAVGAAVDNETDMQQFILPLTIPMILAIVFAQTIITEPNGQIAKIMSQIPFTSPVVMLVRFNFGVQTWEILLSIALLVVTFLLCVYIAAKIYRIGILSYGKKITYSDLWKWIKTK